MAKDVFKRQSGHICYHQNDIFKWQSGAIKHTYTVCHQKTYLTASWQIKRTYMKGIFKRHSGKLSAHMYRETCLKWYNGKN